MDTPHARHAARVGSACALVGGFVTASDDGTLKQWRSDGAFVRTLRGHEHHVSTVRPLPGGRVLSAGYDRQVLVWDLASGAVTTRFEGCKEWVVDATVSADGRRVATLERLGAVRVYDLERARLVARLRHRGSAIALSPTGDRVYVGSSEGLAAYDVAARRLVAQHPTPLQALSVEADSGRLVAIGGRTLLVLDADLAGERRRAHDHPLVGVAADEDGPVTADESGLVVTWDPDGAPNGGYRRDVSAPVRAFAWSGVRGAFLLGLDDGEVVVRPPRT